MNSKVGIHNRHRIHAYLAGACGMIGAVYRLSYKGIDLFVALHLSRWLNNLPTKSVHGWLGHNFSG